MKSFPNCLRCTSDTHKNTDLLRLCLGESVTCKLICNYYLSRFKMERIMLGASEAGGAGSLAEVFIVGDKVVSSSCPPNSTNLASPYSLFRTIVAQT